MMGEETHLLDFASRVEDVDGTTGRLGDGQDGAIGCDELTQTWNEVELAHVDHVYKADQSSRGDVRHSP